MRGSYCRRKYKKNVKILRGPLMADFGDNKKRLAHTEYRQVSPLNGNKRLTMREFYAFL